MKSELYWSLSEKLPSTDWMILGTLVVLNPDRIHSLRPFVQAAHTILSSGNLFFVLRELDGGQIFFTMY